MLDVDDKNACGIDMINFSINKRVQLREMFTADPTLRTLQRVVYSGWSDTIKDLPRDLRPYWSYRDEIGISDGVIFKGKQVIIPDALRNYILHQLHEAHLRIEKTRLLMRESVYWPNIYKELEMTVKCWAVCKDSQPEHRQQHLLAHDVPSTPWINEATICSRSKGTSIYLLPIFTPSPILSRRCTQQPAIQSPTSLSAECFSMFGPPLEIVTDNGPQYYDSHTKTCAVNGTSNTLRHRPDILNRTVWSRDKSCQ